MHLKEREDQLEMVDKAASESNAKILVLKVDGERLRSQAASPRVYVKFMITHLDVLGKSRS